MLVTLYLPPKFLHNTHKRHPEWTQTRTVKNMKADTFIINAHVPTKKFSKMQSFVLFKKGKLNQIIISTLYLNLQHADKKKSIR